MTGLLRVAIPAEQSRRIARKVVAGNEAPHLRPMLTPPLKQPSISGAT